jgi:hypothetical protein
MKHKKCASVYAFTADANFERKSVKELQNYLKERGVIFSDLRKTELVEICETADRLKCIQFL